MGLTKKQALAELARRTIEEQADFYVPHAEQQKFHESKARIRGIFAGNRFGKTWAGAMDLYWHVTKQHPYWKPLTTGPVRARACSETYQVMKDSMIADTFMKMVPRRFLRGKSWKTAWSEANKKLYFTKDKPILGGEIDFKSYDQDEEAFRGVARHIIWEDEEAPEALHRENMARLLTTDGILIITMTPIKPSMWVISDIYEAAEKDPRIEVFEGDSEQNPHVGKEALQMMLDSIKDPVEREARKTGKFTWYAGKIYPQYGDKNRIDTFKPPKEWPLIIGIDPHDTKNCAVNFGYWNPLGSLYILDELWIEASIGVDAWCDQIKIHIENREVEAVLVDPSSNKDPKAHEVESIFKKISSDRNFPDAQCWLARAGSVWSGIQDVRELIKPNQVTGLPKFFVDPIRCPMTDWQMAHYGLKPPTKAQVHTYNPQPIKVKEDFCDCARGIVVYGPPESSKPQRRGQEEDRFGIREFN